MLNASLGWTSNVALLSAINTVNYRMRGLAEQIERGATHHWQSCGSTEDPGDITTTYEDADASQTLSLNDRFKVTYRNCSVRDSVAAGTVTLTVLDHDLSRTSIHFDRLATTSMGDGFSTPAGVITTLAGTLYTRELSETDMVYEGELSLLVNQHSVTLRNVAITERDTGQTYMPFAWLTGGFDLLHLKSGDASRTDRIVAVDIAEKFYDPYSDYGSVVIKGSSSKSIKVLRGGSHQSVVSLDLDGDGRYETEKTPVFGSDFHRNFFAPLGVQRTLHLPAS